MNNLTILTIICVLCAMMFLQWRIRQNSKSRQLHQNGEAELAIESPEPQTLVNSTIDTTVLAQLAKDTCVEDFPNLIDVFLTELETRCDGVRAALKEDNEKNLRIQVHSIKSCARTFGAPTLATMAADIEQDIINNQLAKATEEIPLMLSLLPGIKQEFIDYKNNLS